MFQASALCPSLWPKAKAQNVSLRDLSFWPILTVLNQSLKPNYLVMPLMQYHSFVRNILLYACDLVEQDNAMQRWPSKKGKREKEWWSYEKIFIDWVSLDWKRKHLALGHKVQTSPHSLHVSLPWAKCFPSFHSYWVNKFIIWNGIQ